MEEHLSASFMHSVMFLISLKQNFYAASPISFIIHPLHLSSNIPMHTHTPDPSPHSTKLKVETCSLLCDAGRAGGVTARTWKCRTICRMLISSKSFFDWGKKSTYSSSFFFFQSIVRSICTVVAAVFKMLFTTIVYVKYFLQPWVLSWNTHFNVLEKVRVCLSLQYAV